MKRYLLFNKKLGSVVPYHTYNEVFILDTTAQMKLLHHGDAAERVWAALGIGLTLGASAIPHFRVSLQESPSPGTRRTLLVVLAGLGEQDVLHTFAQDDPDDYVRATACRYLIRTSPDVKNDTFQFVRER